MTIDPDNLRSRRYIEASKIWLELRKPYLRKRTYELYEQHIKQTTVFFGDMPLKDIHIGQMREFQTARKAGEFRVGYTVVKWKKKAGPSLINHECVAVAGILDSAGEWEKIARFYRALPLPSWKPPKVMSDEEEMVVFAVAKEDPGLELAFLALTLGVNTGAVGTELRHIRIGDVHLEGRRAMFFVCGETAKNEHRGRPVMLNTTGENAMRRCLEIAASRGCYLPEHYLFCIRDDVTRKWDPTRPASESWMRRPLEKLRKRTGFKWLVQHMMRHQHITIRIDAGEPIEPICEDVGHKDVRMTRWYYHARGDRQAAAVDAIDPMVRLAKKPVQPERGNVVEMRRRK